MNKYSIMNTLGGILCKLLILHYNQGTINDSGNGLTTRKQTDTSNLTIIFSQFGAMILLLGFILLSHCQRLINITFFWLLKRKLCSR